MAYGLTFDQVRQTNRPMPQHQHWGSITPLTEMPQYAMCRMDIVAGGMQPLHFFAGRYQAFVEAGKVTVRSLDSDGGEHAGTVNAGEVFPLPKFLVHGFESSQGATIYLIGPRTGEPLRAIYTEQPEAAAAAFHELSPTELPNFGESTADVREKYWGRIETIVSDDEIAAKRISLNTGVQGSLEYHVEKYETYYIHSGQVKVCLRIGRAENRSIIMKPGESYDVRPGAMHARMALEDAVIIEASTRDSDSDSYLVEDGQTYRHNDIDSQSTRTEKQEQPA